MTHAELVASVTLQHGQITTTMGRLLDRQNPDTAGTFGDLKRWLAVHEAAEQAAVHPLDAAAGQPELGAQLSQSEDEAGMLVGRLEQFAPGGADFSTQAGLLSEAVALHAEQEEHEELPALAGLEDDAYAPAVATMQRARALASDAQTFPVSMPFTEMVATATRILTGPAQS